MPLPFVQEDPYAKGSYTIMMCMLNTLVLLIEDINEYKEGFDPITVVTEGTLDAEVFTILLNAGLDTQKRPDIPNTRLDLIPRH